MTVRKIKLKPVIFTQRTYCGPVAIAAITGKDVERVIKDILNQRKKRLRKYNTVGVIKHWRNRGKYNQVKSMTTQELAIALEKYGYRLVQLWDYKGKELHEWHFEKKIYASEAPHLVVAHYHFIAVQGWNCVDAMCSRGAIIPFGKYSRPRAIVTEAYRVERISRQVQKKTLASVSLG